jgi:acyl carrier protein
VEEVLAGIWRELLRVEQVGREDDFFELGGHSLLAMRAISRLRELLRVELPVRAFFKEPTLRALSKIVELQRGVQAVQEARWLNARAEDLREHIDQMHEDSLQADIAKLEKELSQTASGRSVPG